MRPTEAVGIVGPQLRAQGVRPLLDVMDLSMMGITGPLLALPRLLRALHHVTRAIERFQPDVVVCVDSPSFNLRVAQRLRIPCLQWVSPQIWAWRPGRAKRIAASVDALATLFPFEPGLYGGTGLRVEFTGHPLVDRPWSTLGEEVAVVAGSRTSERRRLGPVFREATAGLPRLEACPPTSPVLGGMAAVSGIEGLAGRARCALACSGTATLELAALGIPMVVAYATDPLTYALARNVIRVPHVALPNLVAGRAVVPEFIQDLQPSALRNALEALDVSRQRAELREVRGMLRPDGAVDRVANLVDDIRRYRRTKPR